MGAKEAYQQKLDAQLKIWNAEIDKWRPNPNEPPPRPRFNTLNPSKL